MVLIDELIKALEDECNRDGINSCIIPKNQDIGIPYYYVGEKAAKKRRLITINNRS